jgi:hypothetical protein
MRGPYWPSPCFIFSGLKCKITVSPASSFMYLDSDFHNSLFDSRFFLAVSFSSWVVVVIFLFHLFMFFYWQIGFSEWIGYDRELWQYKTNLSSISRAIQELSPWGHFRINQYHFSQLLSWALSPCLCRSAIKGQAGNL